MNKDKINQLENLTEEEKKAVLDILNEYSNKGTSDIYQNLIYADYKEIPVDIDTFLHDPRYLGKGLVDDEGRFTVFPYWEKKLKELFPNNLDTTYNNVILTGQGISNISKSDIAGKINLNIPVKIATGRLISTVRPEYRTSYALVRYIAARPFVKSVSNSIDNQTNENIFKTIIERVKEFFYS